MLFMLKVLYQRCVFQSLFAKQHRIAIIRALAPTENVSVLLDGTPKLTVQVSTKISKLRACVSTGNSHVWHPHILRLQVTSKYYCHLWGSEIYRSDGTHSFKVLTQALKLIIFPLLKTFKLYSWFQNTF